MIDDYQYQKDDYATGPASSGGIDIWRALRKRWLPALATAATFFVGVAFYTKSQIPIFSASTVMLLDDVSSLPVTATSSDIYRGYFTKNRTTEIQLLRSPLLVSRALETVPNPYKDQLGVEMVMGGLNIKQLENADVLVVSYADTDPNRIKAVLQALSATYINYSRESRRSQATNAIRFIQEQLPPARQSLNRSANSIRNFRESNGMVDPDSYAAAISTTRQSQQQELQQAQAELTQVQKQEVELRRQMAAVGQNEDTILKQSVLTQDRSYQSLLTQLREIEVKLALARITYREDSPTALDLTRRRDSILTLVQQQAQRILGDSAPPLPDLATTGSLPASSGSVLSDSLLSQPSTSTASLDSSAPNAAPLPELGSIQQQLATQMLEVQTKLAIATARVNSTQQVGAELASRFSQIPQLQQTYAELQRQNKVDSQVVDEFLGKLQELQITEAQESSPWRVLEPPRVPQVPISPNTQRNLMLGLVAGSLLGLGVALLLERLDQRVKGVDEAKDLTGLPLLGAIPKVDADAILSDLDGSNRRPHNAGRVQLTEAFRSAALNLGYLGSTGQMKVLAFTSAIPAEGKTTVTYQLSLALAELGRRVLLVDSAMRRPSQHRLLQEPNATGLSTAIATDRPWQDMVHEVLEGRLYALTSGPLPPNPVSLLGSERMSQLIGQWRQTYDYVLIDTPPVVGITDAQSVATQVDGMVLVLGMERSERPTILRALEILRTSQSNLVGVIINFLSGGQSGYYYQYYSTYYAAPEVTEEDEAEVFESAPMPRRTGQNRRTR